MTTKELLALVERWRSLAEWRESNISAVETETARVNLGATAKALRLCADELAPIATALCAEVEALRKDAERLDWIEQNEADVFKTMSSDEWAASTHGSAHKFAPTLRAAIDAAKEPK